MKKTTASAWERLFTAPFIHAFAIFFIACTVRIVLNIVLKGWSVPPTCDAAGYEELGINLLTGHGFSQAHIGGATAGRLPFLPIVISWIYGIAGQHEVLVRFVLSCMDSVTAVLIYLLGRKIYSAGPAFTAGLVYAFSPFAFGECLQLSSEVPFTLFLLAGTYVLYIARNELRPRSLFMSGALLALATLTRPTSLYLPVFLAIVIFLQQKDLTQRIAKSLLFLMFFSLCFSPWIVRNLIEFKKPIPGGVGTGLVLLGSHNPDVFTDARRSGTWYYGPRTPVAQYTRNEFLEDKAMTARAIGHIRTYWYKMPLHELNKLKYFWNFIPSLAEGEATVPGTLLGLLSFGIFIPFFIWGLRDLKRKDMLVIWTVIGYFHLIMFATYGSIRMRYPINPFIYMIAVNYAYLFAKNIARNALPARRSKKRG